MFNTKAALCAAAIIAATPAYAEFQFADEVEPNDSFATAQLIPLTLGTDYDAFSIVRGTLEPSGAGIQDFFAFDLYASGIPGRSGDSLRFLPSVGYNLTTNVNGVGPTLTFYDSTGSIIAPGTFTDFGRYVVGVSLPSGSTDYGYRLGVILGTVPEPSTWALMLAGFGLVGYALRRRPQPSYLARTPV